MFLAAMLLASSIILAPTDTQTAYVRSWPVQIASCSVDGEYQVYGGDVVQRNLIGTQLDINFTNQTAMPISSVTFVVSDGSHQSEIVDNGTFSPGVSVAHTFESPFSGLASVTCEPSTVAFADGSQWTVAALDRK
jgi:hypothetical protein